MRFSLPVSLSLALPTESTSPRSDMEAVQNLRTAIFAFKQRAEAAEEGSKKREKLTDQALNYLYRCVLLSSSPFAPC